MLRRRVEGLPAPWTSDSILGTHKFCNTFRYTDRVSQDLIVKIINMPISALDDIFNVVMYRFFSNPDTYGHICATLGHRPIINDLTDCTLTDILDSYMLDGNTLYTDAFILCASSYFGQKRKHQNHIELFRHMFLGDNFASKVLATKSMKNLVELLQTYPMVGPFMSYQIANDLCYLDSVHIDPNTYTVAGPGALRGIAKAFESTGSLSSSEVILYMYKNQHVEFAKYGYDFFANGGEELGLVDCQGLFCELDKYCRVARPDLLSNRVNIKKKYADTGKIPTKIHPNKWAQNSVKTL